MCFLCASQKSRLNGVKLALKKTTCASQVLPTMLVRRQHPGSTHHCLLAQNLELTPNRQLFQEAHMCASWVLPSVTSLTERSVCNQIFQGLKLHNRYHLSKADLCPSLSLTFFFIHGLSMPLFFFGVSSFPKAGRKTSWVQKVTEKWYFNTQYIDQDCKGQFLYLVYSSQDAS